MSIHITRASEPITIQTVIILVYGQPGIGKTSLASTSESPLLLDFDRGAHRSGFRRDTVQVERWGDISSMAAADLAEYKTIVVDTVGRLLDLMSADIIQRNPKMQGYGGALSLQGYGALKAAYATWLGTLRSMGKDIVLVAHEKEDKKGDTHIVRPDIQGGSYGEVFKCADGIAYMYRSGRSTILDFSPTDTWVGKNAGGFEPLVIPDFNQTRDYFATVIADTKSALNRLSEEQTAVVAAIAEWQAKAEEATTAEEVNALVAEVGTLAAPVGPQAKFAVASRAKALSLEWKGAKGKKGEGAYVAIPANDDRAAP
jgi:hypothetical protein